MEASQSEASNSDATGATCGSVMIRRGSSVFRAANRPFAWLRRLASSSPSAAVSIASTTPDAESLDTKLEATSSAETELDERMSGEKAILFARNGHDVHSHVRDLSKI